MLCALYRLRTQQFTLQFIVYQYQECVTTDSKGKTRWKVFIKMIFY